MKLIFGKLSSLFSSFLVFFFVGFECCLGAKTTFCANCVICMTFVRPLFEKGEQQSQQS